MARRIRASEACHRTCTRRRTSAKEVGGSNFGPGGLYVLLVARRVRGAPHEDLAALSKAEILLQGLSSDDDRRQLAAEIAEERRLIQEYLRNQIGRAHV